jgi:hypothetical protein
VFFNVKKDEERYVLRNFSLKNINVKAEDKRNNFDAIDGVIMQNVELN